MKLKAIPRAGARVKTAYDLMVAVNKALLAEPARLNMTTWVGAFRDKVESIRTHSQGSINFGRRRVPIPACGTVGCYAGWTVLLKDGFAVPTARGQGGASLGEVPSRAMELLAGPAKVPVTTYSVLFSPTYLDTPLRRDLFDAFTSCTDGFKAKSGTKAYAKEVVKRFTVVMDKHEAELKARLL